MRWTVEVKLFYNIRKVKFLKILFNSMGKKIGKKLLKFLTKPYEIIQNHHNNAETNIRVFIK
jgi:hypothetical protein